jgi:hypothetical protein
MTDDPCETVNLESIKILLNSRFAQQKTELTNDLSQSLAQVNIEHQADVERQITKIDKKIVGWYPFVLGLIITIIISIVLSFLIITWYHEKYLTMNRFERDTREAQARDKGTTRAIHIKRQTDAQIDSMQNEQLKAIKK